jgi:hypothetical protein
MVQISLMLVDPQVDTYIKEKTWKKKKKRGKMNIDVSTRVHSRHQNTVTFFNIYIVFG